MAEQLSRQNHIKIKRPLKMPKFFLIQWPSLCWHEWNLPSLDSSILMTVDDVSVLNQRLVGPYISAVLEEIAFGGTEGLEREIVLEDIGRVTDDDPQKLFILRHGGI
ncbi:hypothetical protein QE152_g16961 [Popillia japonica]|uniref:Uncharacterized protein n=1 Tax=Popillia japonica TaxID=7064 RepID=A0AAW1L347_POPJA